MKVANYLNIDSTFMSAIVMAIDIFCPFNVKAVEECSKPAVSVQTNNAGLSALVTACLLSTVIMRRR